MTGTDTSILLAYDGSDHAKRAIEVAGKRLAPGGRALVATVYEPLGRVPFVSVTGLPMDEETADTVFGAAHEAAQRVAEEGASLARAAGFDAEALAYEGGPAWSAISQLADERNVDLIVIGSRGLSGVKHVVLGSVAAAVAQHSRRSILIVHDR
ncbi:MAG TPA: universal stress protein [Solirubrobacterales bacterium]|nr:universal stress protein [Solirubrobacterales bacterium]